ncbi:hypothetical protein NUACC26_093810 [Scytonema sp. NUACC26]
MIDTADLGGLSQDLRNWHNWFRYACATPAVLA